MNLENRKQKVTPLSDFMIRLVRYILVALLLIVVSLGIGTMGYHHFGQLSWIDSFHMTCMILTGMGPVAEMKTDAAKMFSSFYALYSGLAFLSSTAVFFAPIIHRILHILNADIEETNPS